MFRRHAHLKIVERDDKSCADGIVVAPLEYWQRTRIADTDSIRAPWGETAYAPAVRLFGRNFYNPYYSGCHNSHRFFEWQRARALLLLGSGLLY